jgi:hypothetical protein
LGKLSLQVSRSTFFLFFLSKLSFGIRFVAYENKTAETVMLNHLQNWIQEKDLQEISSLGFTSVRVPVGYWNIVEDPYHLFVPMNLSVSDYYLDWLFQTTAKYNLSILLDLHGGKFIFLLEYSSILFSSFLYQLPNLKMVWIILVVISIQNLQMKEILILL